MTAGADPRTPGWYLEPSDPTLMRHWNGDGWDTRRRSLPAWWIGTTEFEIAGPDADPLHDAPIRPATLTATATAGSGHPARRHRTPSPGSTPHPSPRVRAVSGGGPAMAAPPVSAVWSGKRTALLVACALVGLTLLTLAATIGVARTPVTPSNVAQDTSFVVRANVACTSAMGGARLGTTTAISAEGVPTTPSLPAVRAANVKLEALAATLMSLGIAPTALGDVQGWLDNWTAYAHDRAQAAAYVAAHPDATGPTADHEGALAGAAQLDATRADAFALTNGLTDCTLAVHPSASVVPIT